MSAISNFLNQIRTAIRGEEVRSSIANSIEQCYTDVTNGITLADAAAINANEKAALAQQKAGLVQSLIDTTNASESTRNAQESARVTAEQGRASAETSRTNAETARAGAENTRASNETSRQNAESARGTQENARATAEQGRVSAEIAREALMAKIDGMTVSVAGLPTGAQPTVELGEVDEVKHLAFGIPKGESGVHVGANEPTDDSYIWIDTGAPGGYSGTYPREVNDTDTVVTLEMLPNIEYVYTVGLTTLTLTFGAALENYTTEYRVRFVSGDAAPVVTLPASVVWSPAAPVFEPAHSYELSFTPMGGGYMGVWTALEVA